MKTPQSKEPVQCTLTNPSPVYNPERDYTRTKIKRALRSSKTPLMMTSNEAGELATFLANWLYK